MRRGSELFRFLVVNGVNTVLYYGLYLAFLLVLPYLAANVASLVLAVLAAYWLNARYAFRVGMSARSLAGFVAGQAVTVLLRTAVVWGLVGGLGLDERLAPPVAVAVVLPVAFVLTKLVLVDRSARQATPRAVPRSAPRAEDPVLAAPMGAPVVS